MRIYNPQNQFGKALETQEVVANNLAQTLKGMGVDQSYIDKIHDDQAKGDNVTHSLYKLIQENSDLIAALQSSKLSYEVANQLPDPLTLAHVNKIFLIPKDGAEGKNVYTEYLVLNRGTQESPQIVAEKLGEVGIDTQDILDKITAINEKLGDGFSKESTATAQLAAVKATADSALQSISAGTSGTGVTVTVSDKGTGTTQTVAVTVQDATTSQKGIVQLSAATDSDSASTAATSGAVKTAVANLSGTAVVSSSTSSDGHVTATLGGTVGAPTVTVTTNDIAGATALAGVSGRVDALEAKQLPGNETIATTADVATAKGEAIAAAAEDATTKANAAEANAKHASVASVEQGGAAGDIVKVVPTTTAGAAGVGSSVTLAATFTAATLTDGVISGTGLASGAQVASAITKAVSDEESRADAKIDSAIQAITFTDTASQNATISIVNVTGENAFNATVTVADAADTTKGVVTLNQVAGIADTQIAAAKATVTSAGTITADGLATATDAKHITDAAVAAQAAIDEAKYLTAVTADGTSTGCSVSITGAALTPAVKVVVDTATQDASSKALSGDGFASGDQVQANADALKSTLEGEIADAVADIVSGETKHDGQVLTETVSVGDGFAGLITLTGVDGFELHIISVVDNSGEMWSGIVNDAAKTVRVWAAADDASITGAARPSSFTVTYALVAPAA